MAAGGGGWRHRPWWSPCPNCKGSPPPPPPATTEEGFGARSARAEKPPSAWNLRVFPGSLSGALCSLKMEPWAPGPGQPECKPKFCHLLAV